MGYVIMTFSSARISERRARIIYIWMHLSFPTFFSLFRLQKKAAILIKNPSPFFLFFLFPYRKNSTARTIHQINQAVALVLLCVSHHLTYLPSVPSL
ncbi:BTE_collapsed_G0033440.mRNA.1.CDS.1 [Saccharomyces cerevisiae]|nr:BTE_collapsed_G0033440.mRNA.1.CDS.1 [Saccharomyces cerevisiae]